ncbi:LPS export ABC transporter periplasmic protein LptC [Francisella sp. TX07-6608]|uniref:LPS export ABC transporter periplasmic protein LptC n=1 Tax=Francisella sp. TX07-6608 TaxID=573568 RepID=UPI0008F9B227|nr:LPS export ABC transporter periplasmic protein LptC [Francisella sp. TX07-6608]OIN83794.1 LPS export ABC transporter periplasmic protein LptC [Francisella sp. TX07-6608]
MKFFTKYSLFANVLSIIVIIFSMLYISYNALDGGKPLKNIPQKNHVELKTFDFNYNKYDSSGNLAMSFFAKELQRYLNQDLYMTDITEKSYDKATEKLDWQVQAKHAQQLANQNLIHLYDGVNAIMITKKSADNTQKTSDNDSTPDKIYIKSSEMFYNSSSKDFYNSRFTKMYDPKTGNNTAGTGVKGNSETKIIELSQNVRSYYATS